MGLKKDGLENVKDKCDRVRVRKKMGGKGRRQVKLGGSEDNDGLEKV